MVDDKKPKKKYAVFLPSDMDENERKQYSDLDFWEGLGMGLDNDDEVTLNDIFGFPKGTTPEDFLKVMKLKGFSEDDPLVVGVMKMLKERKTHDPESGGPAEEGDQL